MIYRSEHSAQNGFFLFSRKTAQDKNLSFQARGLLAYILSKPPKWKAKDSDIMRQGGIKKHAWGTILKELKDSGYAMRIRRREKDGTFTFGLEVSEEPRFIQENPLPDFPVVDGPSMDSPLLDSPSMDINSTRAGATNTLSTDQREIRDTPVPSQSARQPKPRRGELYVLPPDSMLTLNGDDLAWLKLKAPNVTDPDRTTEKWFLKQQKNIGRGHTIAEWKANWQGYMMNYSDGQIGNNSNNGNGKPNERPVWMAAEK